MAGQRVRGRVKWFDNEKGYGFIQGEGKKKDIFVHYSAIQCKGFKALQEEEEVEFEVTETPRGLQAENVVKVADIVQA